MKYKGILINPWVYDFAAVNLWSKPLGLLKTAECLSRFELELALIDCMDIFYRREYGTGKYPAEVVEKPEILKSIPRHFRRYGISLDVFKERFKSLLPCDVVFVTSVMSYWYPGVQKIIEMIKFLSPDTPVILGGIYATLWHRHACRTSGADIVYKRHISEKIKDELQKIGIRLKEK